jgi:hypothetical protein
LPWSLGETAPHRRRWGLNGAEAVLQLRAIRVNGDFDTYWRYHLDQEQHRVHNSRYNNHVIPAAA